MTLLKLANTEQNVFSIPGEPATNNDVPTSFTDVVTSAWDMSQKNHKTFSKSNLINQLEEERRDIYRDIDNAELPAFEEEAVSNVQDLLQANEVDRLKAYLDNDISLKEKKTDDFIMQKRMEDSEKYRNLLTSTEIREEARKRARESIEEHERTVASATNTAGILGTFIGSGAASMTDIVNIATMPLGAVRGAGLLKTFAQEALIQGAVETGIQVPVSKWQREIGNKYGLGDATANILGAGILGGGISTTVKAAGNAIRRGSVYFGLNQNNPNLPKQQRIAAGELSKVEAIDEANPSNKMADDISIQHQENVKEMTDAISRNENVSDMQMKVTDKEFSLLNPEFKFDKELKYRAGLEDIERFQKSVFYDLGDADLKYSQFLADRFSRFISRTNVDAAITRPTGMKFKTRRQAVDRIDEIAKEEVGRFPNVTPQAKDIFSVEKVGDEFEIMSFEPNIALKKGDDDVIMTFKTKKEADSALQGTEYSVKTKNGYSIVQGDGGKLINKDNVSRIKFYDNLQKPPKEFELDPTLKVEPESAPASMETLPEPVSNSELKIQTEALNATDNLDARLTDLDTLVDEKPTFKVELDDERTITVKALKKELDQEKSILEQMKVCAL